MRSLQPVTVRLPGAGGRHFHGRQGVAILYANLKGDSPAIKRISKTQPIRPVKTEFEIKATGEVARKYDFAAARLASPIKTTNTVETISNLIKTCLGGGVLGIHTAYKQCGLVSALFINILAGLLLIHSKYILITSAQLMYGRLQMPSLSYPDLMEAVAQTGPFPKLTKRAQQFRCLAEAVICIHLFGSCCVYAILTARTIQQVVERAEWVEKTNTCIYVACMLIPCVLIVMILTMKQLAPFSILGNILLLIIAGSTIYYGSKEATKSPAEFPFIKSAEGLFEFLGICVFSMEGMGVAIPIENHMKQPKKFPKVLFMGMSAVIGFVACIGFFGYWGFGEKATTPITLNFPWETFPTILKTSLAVVIYVTFALNFWASFNLMWSYIKLNYDPKKYRCVERVYRGLFVLGLIIVALVFPNIDAFMGLLDSFCISLIGFLFPTYIEVAVKWEDPGMGKYRWRLYKNGAVFVFGVFLCIMGTYSNIKSMIISNS